MFEAKLRTYEICLIFFSGWAVVPARSRTTSPSLPTLRATRKVATAKSRHALATAARTNLTSTLWIRMSKVVKNEKYEVKIFNNKGDTFFSQRSATFSYRKAPDPRGSGEV